MVKCLPEIEEYASEFPAKLSQQLIPIFLTHTGALP